MSIPPNLEVSNYPGSELPSKILQTRHFFEHTSVNQFSESDFDLQSHYKIGLKYADVFIILFYGENKESIELCKIFASAANYRGPSNYGAVNLIHEKRIAQAFASLNNEPNHPMYPFAMQQIPFIIVYRQGWPKAFYNGPRVTQKLVDYAYVKAPQTNYIEMVQKMASSQVDNGLSMPGVSLYDTKGEAEINRDSTQFRGGPETDIRGFYEGNGIEQTGSIGEQEAYEGRTMEADLEGRNEALNKAFEGDLANGPEQDGKIFKAMSSQI